MAKTYEVHEQVRGDFVWHVWDEDGNLVDWWSKNQKIEDVGGVPTWVGQSIFHTEDEAKAYVEKTYKAKQKTKFTEA